mmetsp:Transcript_20060/g.36252  ORF Transcript_20060/g.36252 Transcript_20060/m.36252 type:complete len:96 (+) Transcript_20060:205-492(+)
MPVGITLNHTGTNAQTALPECLDDSSLIGPDGVMVPEGAPEWMSKCGIGVIDAREVDPEWIEKHAGDIGVPHEVDARKSLLAKVLAGERMPHCCF